MSVEENIELRQMQLLEKEILIKFTLFCQKYNLRYTLIGGTLLGAIRHGGFIPWDDDIDVGMPRPDYEQFLKIVKKKRISPELSVIAGDTDQNFSLPFAKIVNEETIIINECQTHEAEGNSLWIDVMPIDGVGNNLNNAKKIMKKATFYQKALGRASSLPWKCRKGEHGIYGFLKCFYRQLYRIHSYNFYKKKLITLGKSHSFESSNYAAIVVSGFYGYGEIVNKNSLLTFCNKEFEGDEFKVMGCWNEYLTGIYGDYMKLPPKEKRICPHNLKIKLKNKMDGNSYAEGVKTTK